MRGTSVLALLIIFPFSVYAQPSCKSDGNCPDCDFGECKVVTEVTVSPGMYTYTNNPSCMADVSGANDVVTALQAGAKGYLGDYAGSVSDLLQTNEAQRFISDNIHGELGKALNGGNRATAQCQQLCLVLPSPSKAQYTSYNIEAAEESGEFAKCNPGTDCPIGWSKWEGEPDQASAANTQAVCGTFMNWSGDRTRKARMSAYFMPNKNWVRQK